MVRDPLEVCFSNLRELFSSANPFSYEMGELAAWFIDYRRLMEHWHALFPGRILDVDYAELTRDPETVMRRVAAFCGIDYVPGMRDPRSSTRAVATASAVQVREGVVRRETPKWRPTPASSSPWPMRCGPAASRYRAFKPPGACRHHRDYAAASHAPDA